MTIKELKANLDKIIKDGMSEETEVCLPLPFGGVITTDDTNDYMPVSVIVKYVFKEPYIVLHAEPDRAYLECNPGTTFFIHGA